MKKMALFAMGMLLAAHSAIAAEKVVVIVNAANSASITKDQIKAIYSDNMIAWQNGNTIKAYDLPIKNRARESFSLGVMGISATDVAMEWANKKITNTAKNPPKTQKENLVVMAVAKDANAIGYVSADAIKGRDGVKVVLTLE